MKKKKTGTFQEGYIVKYNIKKPDGFWDIGREEDVFVTVKHGVNEKCNHERAEKDFRKSKNTLVQREDDLKIISVTYM